MDVALHIGRTLSILAIHVPAIAGLALFRRHALPAFFKRLLVRLGPVYIKLGQVISTRRDILPPAYLEQLAELRSQVPPATSESMRAVLERNFPGGARQAFVHFDSEPIAAGSVAQVYRARLETGDEVAVKVLRPGVRRAIEGNFCLLLAGARLGAWFSASIRCANILGILHELRELLLSQTDLSREAENLAEFKRAFEHDRHVTTPRVYRELSTAEVLVTEFISAVAPCDYRRLNIAPPLLAQKVDALLDDMVFMKGLCHADLHPGNFFWNASGQIVLIDFGLVHRLPKIDRNHIMTFYFAIVDGYYDFAAEYFLRHFVTGWRRDRGDAPLVTARVLQVLRQQYMDSGGRPRFGEIFNELLRLLARHRLQLTSGYSKIFLTLITVEGYLYELDPDFDMMENARRKRLEQSEYASVPEEAERLALGTEGTYSTAKFDEGLTPEEAYRERNRFVLQDMLEAKPGQLLMDVGCGRGGFLAFAKQHGLRDLGLTLSRVEADVCAQRGLNVVRSSWEDFERDFGASFPPADYITVMEMLSHLGSLHENKEGLVQKRLERFFHWLDRRLAPGGRIYIQELTLNPAFMRDQRYRADYERIDAQLPWVGFTTLDQLFTAATPYFDVVRCLDCSADLVPTYDFILANIDRHRARIDRIMDPVLAVFIRQELHAYRDLSERGLVKLRRLLLVRKP